MMTVVDVGSMEIQGPEERHVAVGNTQQFTAVVRDVAGNVLSGVRVTWWIADP